MLTVYNHRHQQRQCSFCHLALDVPKSLRVNTYDLTLIEACVSGAAGDQSVPREWSVQRPWDGRAAVRSSVLAMPDAPGSAQHASTRQKGVSQPRSTRQRPAPSPLGGKDVRNRGGNLQGHDGPVLREAAPLSPLPPSSCTRSHARQNAAHLKPAPTLAGKYAKRGIAAQHEGPMGRTAPQRQRTAAAEATVQDPHEMPGQRGSCTSGSVAASAVEPEVQELLRAAVRRLRGLRLCEDGHEEARLTHLVLGAQRRTLKVDPEGLWLARACVAAAFICYTGMPIAPVR